MISPDVAAAVTKLEGERVLTPQQARLFGRIARGELVSVSTAIHALLYLGVVALTTGAGLLFRQEIANLGPLTIALAVGAAATFCLAWVSRTSPAFTREEVASPHVAFDYVLGLGALLAAGDLAFVETRFSPLGAQWPFHFLLASAFYLALSFRFDSRALFALALTSFAAWRGVASTSVERVLFGFLADTDTVRLNALACGTAFVIAGRELKRARFKAHFEPAASHLGWLLALQSIAWGIDHGPTAGFHRLVLALVGAGLALFSWRGGRFALFVFGVLAAYLGFMVALVDAVDDVTGTLFLVGVSAVVLVFGLAAVHRRFPKEREE